MTRLSILAAIAALLLGPACSFAGDAPSAATPTSAPRAAAKTAGVVRLDIAEVVREKPSKEAPSTYRIRKVLRDAGFDAYTDKPLAADEYERRKREKEAKEAGAPSPTAEPEAGKPAPDLIIKGKVDVHAGENSTFYGQTVAYSFRAEAELQICDPQGKVLATVEESDSWGNTEEKKALSECEKRIAAWIAAAVLKAEPIHSRLSEKGKAEADRYIANVESKRGPKP
ncbi:MAG TPA: hypothetical protein VHF22_12990, partial [Planctomycetota bacterium]|nr:hypothetical protein [Planctomycetota bacterium]